MSKHPKDHKHQLISRRDLLSQGILGFGAMVSFPSIFGIGMRQALADTCGGPVGSAMLPFMVFDMAGGASLPANFLVGKQGGPEDLLSSYDRLGWDPRESGGLNTEFGLPMSAKYSKLLQGILTNASAAARANLRMGSICHFAQDDTSGNKLNAGTLAVRAGSRGAFIANGLGIKNSASGGNSAPVAEGAALKPNFVSSINDVLGATSFGGPSFTGVGVEKVKALAEGGVALSRVQREQFRDMPGGDVLADLSTCAYEKSLEFVSGIQGLDPRRDTSASAVYQLNQNTDPTSANAVAAALSMNSLKGYSGPSVWTLGGCDYHDGTQTSGDAKDLEMGVQIGRAVELAFRMQKPLFFQLLTDGGNSASAGTRKWSSDSGDKCMTVMGYYNPKAPPKFLRQQVGYYSDAQSAVRTTLIGSDPLLVGYAVFANYLNICGKLEDFHTFAPGIFTDPKQLESVLVFEGKVV